MLLSLFNHSLCEGRQTWPPLMRRRKMATSCRNPATLLLLIALAVLHPVPCRTGSIPGPIKTVVVLVMENRSFDHMLGWMKRLNPEMDGVTGAEANRLNATDPSSARFIFNDTSRYVDADPGHSFQEIREQIFGSEDVSAFPAPMNGFAQQAYSMTNSTAMPTDVMNGFDPESVPVYSALVSEFAVFDRWFASVPASTQPNRLYVHSATSHGATSNVPALLLGGYPQRTIFDCLDEEGLSFGIYYQNIPSTMFYKSLRKLRFTTRFLSYDLRFKDEARAGRLPNYVVVEQRYMDSKAIPANDDHPSHDVFQGQLLVKEVYETLRSGPKWNETLLLITYDEHGGFYDHVPTPVRGVPSPDGMVGPEPFYFKFDRLGVRVPTIAVSPWIEKATVVHRPDGPFPSSEFEHSSISATVKKLFNLSSNYLTKRGAWAGTFEKILQTRTTPRTDCPEQLPTPKRMRMSDADEEKNLSQFQHELIQLAAVLVGDDELVGFPDKIGEKMTVRQGKQYAEDAVKRFLDASLTAWKMGVDDHQIVKMRPSLTTRPTPSTFP